MNCTKIACSLLIAAIFFSLPTTSLRADLTFGQWMASEGYTNGQSLSGSFEVFEDQITSLEGINNCDWTGVTSSTLEAGGLITDIPAGSFGQMPNVGFLVLNTSCTSFPDGIFDGMSSLGQLGFYAPITELPSGVFDNTPNLGEVHIEGTHLT